MAAPTLVQSATVASSAASPVSITPALGGNATAGNLLVLVICVTGTTPTITSPANWTVVRNAAANSVAIGIFFLPNTTAITGPGAVTIGGTGGGAAAAIFEFGNVGANVNLDIPNQIQTGIANSAQTQASVPVPTSATELCIALFTFAAATVNNNTGTTADIVNGSIGAVVSTSGVPNAQVQCYWGLSQPELSTRATIALSASVAFLGQLVRFNPVGTTPIVSNIIYGNAGVYVGAFNQGMIGG